MRPLLCFSALFLSALLLSCHETPRKHAQSTPAKTSVQASQAGADTTWLGYYQVRNGQSLSLLPVPGLVSPLESNIWAVSAPLTGRVDSLRIMLGQSIRRGEHVALLRSVEFADITRDIKLASEQMSLRAQQLRNARTLAEAHAISERDLKELEQSYKEAHLNHQTALDKLQALNIQPAGENAFWLTAPHSGIVVDVEVNTGQEVGPNSLPLIKIARLDQVLVTAQTLEGDVTDLRPGQFAQVTMPGRADQTVSARILSISQAVDSEQHTVPVRLLVSPAPLWLRPNSYVQVSFNQQNSSALLVPSEAVVTDDLQSIVFVRHPVTGKLRRQPVMLGKQSGNLTEIVRGLKTGETIVSRGAILLLNEVNP